MKKIFVVLFAVQVLAAVPAEAVNFSFTGNLANDDTVQLFNFSILAPVSVTLRTLSYGGGTNAVGDVIAPGGFDPIITLFDDTGSIVNVNGEDAVNDDDEDDGVVDAALLDPVTGEAFDSFLAIALLAGNYTVAVTQFDNFFDTLTNRFPGATTIGFVDQTGAKRTSAWAVDIQNVDSASIVSGPGGAVPEPSALLLFGSGLVGFAWWRRKKTE